MKQVLEVVLWLPEIRLLENHRGFFQKEIERVSQNHRPLRHKIGHYWNLRPFFREKIRFVLKLYSSRILATVAKTQSTSPLLDFGKTLAFL